MTIRLLIENRVADSDSILNNWAEPALGRWVLRKTHKVILFTNIYCTDSDMDLSKDFFSICI